MLPTNFGDVELWRRRISRDGAHQRPRMPPDGFPCARCVKAPTALKLGSSASVASNEKNVLENIAKFPPSLPVSGVSQHDGPRGAGTECLKMMK